jgi:dinuclear metal center YbgI/SA1388 family protein
MATVSDVLEALERIAPASYAFSWDKIGLQVGDPGQTVLKAVASLDRSLAAISFAADRGAQLLLTHHPLIFEPLGSVTSATYEGRAISELIRRGISHIAAHTNWDAAPGGINDALAAHLGLTDVKSFGSAAATLEFKVVVFAPRESVDAMIDACASAGAGVIGDYRRCAFIQEGVGTFEAGTDANPAIGPSGERSSVDETRIEMVCPEGRIRQVLAACRSAHPYEEPAIDIVSLRNGSGHPMGRVGTLQSATNLADFVEHVDNSLATRSKVWGKADKAIRRVAVVGGAADSEWRAARSEGADVLLTGEVKQHVALEASESGFALISAGHYETEQPGCTALAKRMSTELPEVAWEVFEPSLGEAGRPL